MYLFNHSLKTVTLVLTLAFSGNNFAHDNAWLDANKTPHGGQVRMAGMYHFELVVKPNDLKVYVMDHGNNPIETKDMQAKAVVLTGKDKVKLDLHPAEENLLISNEAFGISDDMKVVLSVTPKGQAVEQARFTPMQKTPMDMPEKSTTE